MSDKRWGCPWHGLIQGGQLNTPAGSISYPVGPGDGSNHLIDFGMPAVSTPAEHAALGMQWSNKAILGSGYLHGQQIPAGAWVYRDDNGANWLVKSSLHGAASSAPSSTTLSLSRFGEIGGKQETYQVVVPQLDYQVDIRAVWGDVHVNTQLFSVHPKGWSAVFSASSYCWLLLSLSGPGENCSATLSFLRTTQQTAGVTHIPAKLGGELGDLGATQVTLASLMKSYESKYRKTGDNGTPPECGGESRLVEDLGPYEGGSSGIVDLQEVTTGGPQADVFGVTGRIIGMVYKPDGSLTEISASSKKTMTQDVGYSYDSANPEAAYKGVFHEPSNSCIAEQISKTNGYISFTCHAQLSASVTVELLQDGVVVASETDSYGYSLSESSYCGPIDIDVSTPAEAFIKTSTFSAYAGGAEFSDSGQSSMNGAGNYAKIKAAFYWAFISAPFFSANISGNEREKPSLSIYVPSAAVVSGEGSSENWDVISRRLDMSVRFSSDYFDILEPVVYSNGVYGIQRRTAVGIEAVGPVATPVGAKAAATGAVRYASFNPVTGEVVRSTSMVNWT